MRRVHKGFHQVRRVAVARLEVRRQPAQHPPQYVRGQVAALDPRADQEPRQPHHPVQVRPALCHVPADPAVARRQLQRRRRDPRCAQPAVRRTHQIAQLAAHQRPRAARMLRRHQGVPDLALRRVLDQNDRQPPHPSRLVGDPRRRGNRRRRPAPSATPAPRACRRQPDPPGSLQSPQRRQAALRRPAATCKPQRTSKNCETVLNRKVLPGHLPDLRSR